jgi:L-ascorbate 6-phosphate lactonase
MTGVAAWPPAFLSEVEADPPAGEPMLWALGGPSFVYRTSETTIWIDPFFANTPGDLEPEGIFRSVAIPIDPTAISRADAVVSTHAHVDHCHRESVSAIVTNTGARCIGPASSMARMRTWDLPTERLAEVEVGDSLRVGDVAVRVYGAHDPDEPGAVTFVFEGAGISLFVSGDTRRGPALSAVAAENALDYALLAFGGDWYMNPEELLEAAAVLGPKTLIPFHWEMWRRQTGDLVALFETYHRLRPPFRLELPLIGDSIVLTGDSRPHYAQTR